MKRRLSGHPQLSAWEALSDEERDLCDLKALFPNMDLWKLMSDPAYDSSFHARALRDRAGRGGEELDLLVDRLIEQW